MKAMIVPSLVLRVFCVALAIATVRPAPAWAADRSAGHWATSSVQVDYRNFPAPSSRPSWATEPVSVDGSMVWTVALFPPSVRNWDDRLLRGSLQAQQELFAVAESTLAYRNVDQLPADQARRLQVAKERLKLLIDREGFVEVETVERPDAVWMRFGYPASKVEAALGFHLAGASATEAAASSSASARAVVTSHPSWDLLWEGAWLTVVVAVTVVAFGMASALGH